PRFRCPRPGCRLPARGSVTSAADGIAGGDADGALLSLRPTCALILHQRLGPSKKKWAATSLHDDALAILLPERVADAVDLAQVLRFLERAVLVAILHDLLGEPA